MLISGPFLRRHFRSLMGAVADDFERALEKARSDMFVVFSSSETWNSVPMWAHYAGNHSGFCVGFDPSTAFKNPSPKSKHPYLLPRKCKYLKAAPNLNRRTINLIDFASSKMDHWSYEREWRFVGLPEDAALRGHMAAGHELLLFQMQPEAITEVVFGVNCSPSLVAEVIDRLHASNVRPELYQVQNSVGYGFERRKILSAQDIFVRPSSGGPVLGITPEMFKGAEDAYVDMMLDADNHRILRNLLNRD